jgi:DNA repair exonuclease SbcCD ATPase subunit
MSESEIAYQFKDFQKQLERLEKDTAEGVGKVEKLQDRVRTLETTKNILVAVALIFGISGSFGWYLLQSAQTRLSQVSAQVEKLENGTKMISDAEQKAVADAKRDIDAERASQLRSFAAESATLTPRLQQQIHALQKWNRYVFQMALTNMQAHKMEEKDFKKKGYSDEQRKIVTLWGLLDTLAGADKPFVAEVGPPATAAIYRYEQP